MKPNKYFLILLVTVVAYGLFEYYRPKPIDWTPTYTNKDVIPFGTRATYELLPGLMRQAEVKSLRLPVYNHLTETRLPERSNYIFVCRELELSKNDQAQLLRYVARGNQVFLSAYYFPKPFQKALGFVAELKEPSLSDTTLGMNFTNPSLRARTDYHIRHDDGRNYLTVKDPKRITVLARNGRREPIFLKIAHGKGTFYIHNLPLALTNYYVLDPQQGDHAFKAFSYLPAQPTYWDEYQKRGRFDEQEQTALRYVLSQPPLAWAWYLTLAGLLMYVIFAGKRTQRVIPVVEPPKNTALEFVQTVGRLYFQQGDHANLAQKKIQHFYTFLRERFNLNPSHPDSEFRQTLARKSGVPEHEVNAVFVQIGYAQQGGMTEYELMQLNEKIEAFYNQVQTQR